MELTWFTDGEIDCTCYRLLQKEEYRLEEALLAAEPYERHFLRRDLRHVKEALVVIIKRNTRSER